MVISPSPSIGKNCAPFFPNMRRGLPYSTKSFQTPQISSATVLSHCEFPIATSLGRVSGSPQVGENKQDAEEQVRGRENQVGSVHPCLQHQHHHGDGVAEFFEDRGNHQR